MALVINTNIASLQAQNNLVSSQNALNQATERLSSGLKINSAADNAAGYAIANRYTTQIGGLQQASSNASDAINLAQTAGSALDQVTSNLNAIRDLAVQAANGTYSASDRASMNVEVQQRLQEISRIANQTTFNNSNILNGALGNTTFQVGANVGQTISVDLQTNVQASAMGGIGAYDSGNLSGAFVTSGSNPVATGLDMSTITIGLTGSNGASSSITLSGVATSAQALADAINAQTSGAVNAAVDGNGGINIFTSTTSTGFSVSGGAFDASSAGGASDSLTSSATTGGVAGLASGSYTAGTAINSATSGTSGMLANGDVNSVQDANALIAQVDSALSTVSNFATQLGAVQNRFQSTISTLSAQTTNLQSSQSTIQDADFAAETAALSQASVLQQAGISVLAQANSNPQMALKLLQ
ncbi:flagellin N-terminal helical domain-containing protein [Rhodanobacter hydrolyticus]|uniref:Flagellin n=1 Tax=Rhodanobacter hydrolyticus TaxID=2250595 RepID=A0ABW8JAM4_9GAMM